jgi:uroporphyrin-III C-methyltransferase/precorrin-2 dehydrogenase/sirohydrochlorin ferrochelatase
MARHFPIFLDLGASPPLVIGAVPGLAAKLRLLTSFAPRVDLLTGDDAVPPALDLPGVQHVQPIGGISPDRAARLFIGRPLLVIDTGDGQLDERLSRRAREIGVPVNVPDRPALCSFYLGSIVDRDPVILAISTGGFAPVLAQRLRAGIEDWLPHHYGRLALYLNRIRHRIRTLPAARRRRLQHRIIDGDAAGWIIDGDDCRADSRVVEMLSDQPGHEGGGLHVIGDDPDLRADEPTQLKRHEIEAIRNADVILHAPGNVPDFVDLARREVEILSVHPAMVWARAAVLTSRGLEVVITPARGHSGHGASPPSEMSA